MKFPSFRHGGPVGAALFVILSATLTQLSVASDKSEITLERIFSSDDFDGKSFSLTWAETGSAYTFLKRSDDDDSESPRAIWFVPGAGQEAEMLVSPEMLTPLGDETPLSIDSYSLSADHNLVLIYTNSQRVWRGKTRGDYWLLNRSAETLRKLGGAAEPATLMFAKISPTGTHVAYVRGQEIYVESLSDHTIRQLTKSSSPHIFHGRFDWVYEEELGIRDGFRWSPDGSAIAFWQFDESGVREQVLVDHVSGLYPKVTKFGYPKAGERNASCRIGVVDLANQETRWMKVPGDPRNHYLARMDWAENSDELVIQQLNRAQTLNRVFLARRADGSTKTIFRDEDSAWVDVDGDVTWVWDGKAFLWLSERDGWKHLYLVSRDGQEIKCLTPGEFDVIDLLGADKANKWVYFIASPDDPASRFLYRAGLQGEPCERITPAEETRGSHSYSISPDGTAALLRSSNADTPSQTRLVDLPGHTTLRKLESNRKLRKTIKSLELSPVEFFDVPIGDGVNLPARCIRPPNFDDTKKYPLLVYVYGEPAGQVVRDSWGGKGALWHHMLAQRGYVVMSFDNRGSRAPLGRAWRKAAHKKIGILPPRDQAAAVRAVLESRSYLDPERVGIWGWSGGGSMSLNAIFKYPDLYRTAMAVASVPDQRHYDTIYQERYMGRPQDNPDNFEEGSPINFADQLEGNLLVIHGAADDNCHYQTYLKLVDELIAHNKPFEMMTYPRGTHSIREGRNARLHLYGTMTRFLEEHLPVTP